MATRSIINYFECPGLPRGFSFAGDPADGTDLRPTGLIAGAPAQAACRAGFARALAGGPQAFTACEVFLTGPQRIETVIASNENLLKWAASEGGRVAEAVAAALDRLSSRRPPFAGVALHRPRLIGVVNVTPDSFYPASAHADADAAIAHGLELIEAGADMLDIGGESTRPGSGETPEAVEITRVVPVIRGLTGRGVPLSIDTRRARVMAAALEAGAEIINDITALTDDAAAIDMVARSNAHVIVMHMQGRPRSMQDDPVYRHAPHEILRYLRNRVAALAHAGVPAARIAIDPGIGFGKTDAHNLKILTEAALFHGTGSAVVIGASRKSFIGRLAGEDRAASRLPGSLAATALAVGQGVQLHRVHDVAETRQALAVLGPALEGGPE